MVMRPFINDKKKLLHIVTSSGCDQQPTLKSKTFLYYFFSVWSKLKIKKKDIKKSLFFDIQKKYLKNIYELLSQY